MENKQATIFGVFAIIGGVAKMLTTATSHAHADRILLSLKTRKVYQGLSIRQIM